jgi:hypothetical protein
MKYIYALLIFSCITVSCNQTNEAKIQRPYNIGSNEYAELAETSFQYMQDFDFENWTDMMSEDVEYYFPDGDVETRSKLVGKKEVMNWWKDWERNSNISSMVLSERIIVPLDISPKDELPKLPGTYAICWITTKLAFQNGTDVSLRMNMDLHFNADKKIDRIWSYYDRSGIIKAMGLDILVPKEED